jgi:uncharacterized protein YjbI with pentapeptide repeats
VLEGARCELCEADMSGALLARAVLTRADLRKANLQGAGFRNAQLDKADLRSRLLPRAVLDRRREPDPLVNFLQLLFFGNFLARGNLRVFRLGRT